MYFDERVARCALQMVTMAVYVAAFLRIKLVASDTLFHSVLNPPLMVRVFFVFELATTNAAWLIG